MFSTTDTIVAIATPPGHGGIGVVRLSGPEALAIATRLLDRTTALRPRYATLATVVDDRSAVIDQVVATWFPAPKSYTGDDVVELATHGSPVVMRRVVELAIGAGARLAEPGEFTLRAYLAGKIDLVQAEAVADLVDAVTPLQARAAMDQLDGTLTAVIASIDSALFDLAARLEASIDFPDEGFHFVTREATITELQAIRLRLVDLARDGRRGRMIREGAVVAIAGRPNAGKSSLFNALIGADRAIVTSVPGTTRDLLTERTDVAGMPMTLVDTAGVRDTHDAIEIEGVRRARAAHDVARLVLVVVDGSTPLDANDLALVGGRSRDRLVVISKSDLPAVWSQGQTVFDGADVSVVSAATGAGLDALRARIAARLSGEEDLRDTPAISNVRHLTLVDQATAAVTQAVEGLVGGATEELALAELTTAREALGAIVGRKSADDLLQHIFSRFCIGK